MDHQQPTRYSSFWVLSSFKGTGTVPVLYVDIIFRWCEMRWHHIVWIAVSCVATFFVWFWHVFISVGIYIRPRPTNLDLWRDCLGAATCRSALRYCRWKSSWNTYVAKATGRQAARELQVPIAELRRGMAQFMGNSHPSANFKSHINLERDLAMRSCLKTLFMAGYS